MSRSTKQEVEDELHGKDEPECLPSTCCGFEAFGSDNHEHQCTEVEDIDEQDLEARSRGYMAEKR